MLWRIKALISAVLTLLSAIFLSLTEIFVWFCVRLKIYSVPKGLYRLNLRMWRSETPHFLSRLGHLHEKIGDLDKAAEYCKEASQLEPEEDSYYWDLGSIYEKQNKIPLAIESYEKALQIGTDFTPDFKNELQSRISKLKEIQRTQN